MIDNFFDLALFGLATWRVSSLLVHEDGPYAVFRRMREASKSFEIFWQLFQCVWCTSVWIGGGVLILWLIEPNWIRIFCLWLSASAIAIAWQRLCRDEEEDA